MPMAAAPKRVLVVSSAVTPLAVRILVPALVFGVIGLVFSVLGEIGHLACERKEGNDTCIFIIWHGPFRSATRFPSVPRFELQSKMVGGQKGSPSLVHEVSADGGYLTTLNDRESFTDFKQRVETYRGDGTQERFSGIYNDASIGGFGLFVVALLAWSWWMSQRITLTFDGERRKLTIGQHRWWEKPVETEHGLLGAQGATVFRQDREEQVEIRTAVEPIRLPRGQGIPVKAIDQFLAGSAAS